jgi:sulfatase maturation enzyme AslB (radical SAM superfamily)
MRCKLLESHVYIGTTGQYRLCCTSAEPNNTENITTHTPIDWLNSKTVTNAIQQLENDEWPDACIKCKLEEEKGLVSRRLEKDWYGPGITHVDLRFGNSCNLKCISCWPTSSSSIGYESIEMAEQGIVPLFQINQESAQVNWYDEKYLEYFNSLPLKEIYMTGGEPMMVKNLSKFLDSLDSQIVLRFNTNATINNPQLINSLKRFSKVIMSCSVDAVGKRNDYIRFGSTWSTVENNVKQYQDLFQLDINPCISVLNAAYYDETLEWADKLRLPIKQNMLITPEWLHVKHAPSELKSKFKYFTEWSSDQADSLQQEIFRTNIQKLDSFRNVRINDFLPEVAQAYGIN